MPALMGKSLPLVTVPTIVVHTMTERCHTQVDDVLPQGFPDPRSAAMAICAAIASVRITICVPTTLMF